MGDGDESDEPRYFGRACKATKSSYRRLRGPSASIHVHSGGKAINQDSPGRAICQALLSFSFYRSVALLVTGRGQFCTMKSAPYLLGWALCAGSFVDAIGARQANWTVGQVVQTSSGPVTGHPASVSTDVSEYLGIPYAVPPVGDLRWAAPQMFNGTAAINGSNFVGHFYSESFHAFLPSGGGAFFRSSLAPSRQLMSNTHCFPRSK